MSKKNKYVEQSFFEDFFDALFDFFGCDYDVTRGNDYDSHKAYKKQKKKEKKYYYHL